MWSIVFAIIVVSLAAVYVWLKKCYDYWRKRQIPYIKVDSLIFGHIEDAIFGRKSMTDVTKEFYDKLGPHRFGGVFNFQNPVLFIRDPDLARAVLTKDSQHFFDRQFYFSNKEKPFTQNLFHLTGDDWKTLRQKLSPVFSPAKVKTTLPLVKVCADQLISVMDEYENANASIDAKDLLARFLIDVVASCFFGIQSNSLDNPNCEFRRMGLKIFAVDWKMAIRNVLINAAPRLSSFWGITFIIDDCKTFFVNLVADTITQRRNNGIIRNDFLNQLMDLIQSQNSDGGPNVPQFTEADIEFMAAQCLFFFLAGYDTSSNASSFALLEIAKDSTIQKRLQAEIDDVWNKCDGNISFDILQELTYMDQVLAETMRIYPAIPVIIRTCTENYPIPNTDCVIERGTVVHIPIYSFHHDAQYFPQPEKFDPERFSDENKKSIPRGAYLPFGEGPKICLGMRFATTSLKLILFVLLQRYTFSVSPQMELPVKIHKRSFIITCDGGIWLKYARRIIEAE